MEHLIELIKLSGFLKSKRVEAALRFVDRLDFVPDEQRLFAYYDEALPIGHGQTISQPSTVVFCLELLDVQEGNVVLDVGAGSGWQTCLLSHLVGEGGKVYALERIPELCAGAKRNCARYPSLKDRLAIACGSAEEEVPNILFDRIVCAASVDDVPIAWRSQLNIGGRMVYPKKGSLYLEKKKDDRTFEIEHYPGFVFVPFILRET